MIEWKDVSSYSRYDKERIPSILELKIEGIRIVVHRIIHYDGWFVSCYDLNIEDEQLYTEDLEDAKIKGINYIVDEIDKLGKLKDELMKFKG